jgi:formamidopyrimidine-DNA glycosylase
MPELPEVETTLRGIKPHVLHQTINKIVVRQHQLRWPIPSEISEIVSNQPITQLARRAKYLLLTTPIGTLILHLGMSGSLRIVGKSTEAKKHDHVDIELANEKILRLTDPRRFGALLWAAEALSEHALLKHLGPEPLEESFSGNHLWQQARGKKVAVKTFLMNNKIVVGVGNIYATEALFMAGIHPKLAAGKISLARFEKLATAIKKILTAAIKQGGTTLKDFVDSEGKPGYFKFQLKVYGRAGLNCMTCKTKLTGIRQGQRSTVYCSRCQK